METWDAIRSRRNVRSYEPRDIAEEDLNRILEAGRRSPSASNKQRWDFVVSTERAQLQELARLWQGAGHIATSAATVVLVAPRADDGGISPGVAYDLGQVTMSMMIAAADLGIGSGHALVSDRDGAARVLGLPADRVAGWMIAFGYPADRPLTPIEKPNRRPFDDVVHRGRW